MFEGRTRGLCRPSSMVRTSEGGGLGGAIAIGSANDNNLTSEQKEAQEERGIVVESRKQPHDIIDLGYHKLC